MGTAAKPSAVSPSDNLMQRRCNMRTIRAQLMMFVLLVTTLAIWQEVQAKPTVYVVNYPLKYFTERIAENRVDVRFPAPSDEDPAFWKPDVDTIAAFQTADLIVLNGATYAKWTEKVSLPKTKIVNTSAGFQDQYIEIKDSVTHSHGPAGEHSHTGTAFTTWLDFRLATQQAKAILTALSRLLPEQKSAFEAQYTALETDLAALDNQLQDLVASKRAQPLVASHPVYQYFARRYGLNLQSVLWEPDVMPDASQWQALQTLLATHPAKWMIWEGEPLAASVDKLQTLGVHSVVFDPCGNTPEQGDFLTVMQQNIINLRHVFE
jgi:zinc transport system substrate-binding protein